MASSHAYQACRLAAFRRVSQTTLAILALIRSTWDQILINRAQQATISGDL
jgi:hypothetical protein